MASRALASRIDRLEAALRGSGDFDGMTWTDLLCAHRAGYTYDDLGRGGKLLVDFLLCGLAIHRLREPDRLRSPEYSKDPPDPARLAEAEAVADRLREELGLPAGEIDFTRLGRAFGLPPSLTARLRRRLDRPALRPAAPPLIEPPAAPSSAAPGPVAPDPAPPLFRPPS